ncbi:MAG: tRNA lysidine(34) synthetase TilS [bacterium]|nr:tRNA lysidine(34) synthetase TilS [bacterium]
MQNIYTKVKRSIKNNSLIEKGDRILLSMSAGKDSITLLHILYSLKEEYDFDCGIFHLNHLVRGKESDLDEEYVANLSEAYDIPLYVKQYDFEANPEPGVSFEEQARNKRYSFLRETCLEHGYNKIATAHNRDDNIETVIMRIFTGTGVHGLQGIEPKRGNIIRPMLKLTADEIYAYLRENRIPWREDNSNNDTVYLRNYVRHRLLPVIEERFPGARDAVISMSALAEEHNSLLNKLLLQNYGPLYEKNEKENGVIYIDHELFCKEDTNTRQDYAALKQVLSTVIRKEFHRYCNRGILNEIIKNLAGRRSNILLYENRDIKIEKLFRSGKSTIKLSLPAMAPPDPGEWSYEIPLSSLSSDREESIHINEINAVIWLQLTDYEHFQEKINQNDKIFVTIPDTNDIINIRNRRKGDRICLESGTKKIKDLLIEKKLDNESKKTVPILIVDSDVAACMPGLVMDTGNRVSTRYRVENSSKKILAIYRK